MLLTIELLEGGIAINAEGKIRRCKAFQNTREGELYLQFSSRSVKCFGVDVMTRKQATQEAFCKLFYYIHCPVAHY
jgi:hypothetical protein